jgi:hypothetical protein
VARVTGDTRLPTLYQFFLSCGVRSRKTNDPSSEESSRLVSSLTLSRSVASSLIYDSISFFLALSVVSRVSLVSRLRV